MFKLKAGSTPTTKHTLVHFLILFRCSSKKLADKTNNRKQVIKAPSMYLLLTVRHKLYYFASYWHTNEMYIHNNSQKMQTNVTGTVQTCSRGTRAAHHRPRTNLEIYKRGSSSSDRPTLQVSFHVYTYSIVLYSKNVSVEPEAAHSLCTCSNDEKWSKYSVVV